MNCIRLTNLLWLSAIAVLAAMCGAPAARAAEPVGDIVKSAASALKAGDYDRAVELYQQAQQAMPNSPAIAYNLGVAQYRKGDYQRAADAFSEAASLANDGSLRSRSIYNLGNAAYAQSLEALKSAADSGMSQDQLQRATDMLKQALDNYKQAIANDPHDEDARANAELSHKFLKRLQELQEKMQQQQQQQQQQNLDQQDQQQQQQQQSQSQQNQSGEQQQQQQQASTSEDSDQQQEPQRGKPQSAEQPQQEQEQLDSEIEPLDEQPPEDQGRHVQHPTSKPDKKAMTRQEAERLLQAVRDKERKRRMDLLPREAAKYAPAEKDW